MAKEMGQQKLRIFIVKNKQYFQICIENLSYFARFELYNSQEKVFLASNKVISPFTSHEI